MTLGNISFGPLHHSTLGFDRFFKDFEDIIESNFQKTGSGFPPHNIIKVSDTIYLIDLAIAGFSRNEIDITVNDGYLIIKGNKEETNTKIEYLHKGIGTRSFTKTVRISDTLEVTGAEFTDGILRIGLENIIPDHKKPKKVVITDSMETKSKSQLLQE
jgi:molecular chaperone IbpA